MTKTRYIQNWMRFRRNQVTEHFTLVQTDHHRIWLGNPDLDWPEYTFDHVALEPHPPTGLYLETGTHTGMIGIQLNVHEAEPELDTRRWPAHETVTLDLASTEFHTIPLAGGGDIVEAELPAPGNYHVRAAWAVRPSENEYVEDGEERYVIDIWPANG